MIKLRLFYICLVTLITASITSCDFYLKSQIGSFRFAYYDVIQNEEYDKAASMFYIPDSLSEKDIQKVQNRISILISLISREYGKINHSKEVPDECKYHITFSTIDTVSLKETPFWAAGIFPVVFEKSEAGWLDVEFHKETWNSFSIRKITYDVPFLKDDFREKIIELDAVIKTTITQKEKLQTRFGEFYSQVLQLIITYNPLDEEKDELNDYEDLFLEYVLNNIDKVENVQEFRDKVYWIFSFGGDETFSDIRKTTDKLAEKIWDEWQIYNHN